MGQINVFEKYLYLRRLYATSQKTLLKNNKKYKRERTTDAIS